MKLSRSHHQKRRTSTLKLASSKMTLPRSHHQEQRKSVLKLAWVSCTLMCCVGVFCFYQKQSTTNIELSMLAPNISPSPIHNKAEDGWHSIDVFYGAHDIFDTKGGKSQENQDRLVAALLHKATNGYFLDLASNHATVLSNTYKLEQQYNWTGICVEPNPRYWPGLAHRECHVAAAVVSKNRLEKIKFDTYDDRPLRAASGGIASMLEAPVKSGTSLTLYTVPIIELLRKYNAPKTIDYLSLDIEGAEYAVMKDFPFELYKFKIMTVERPSQALADLLHSQGYRYVGGNNDWGEETAWVHSVFLKEVDLTATKQVNWIGNGHSTKWVTVDNNDIWAKPIINDHRKKKGSIQ